MAFLSFPSPTQLKNLANPTDNQDAVTLAYLDTALNGSGNIVVANVSANVVTSNNVTANTVTINGVINLGDVANVKIDGGTSGYVLSTDGVGNLSWIAQSSGSGNTALPSVNVDSFVADGSTNSYQLTVTPASKDLIFVNIDGVLQIRDSFDLFGNAISFGSTPIVDSVIEVSTFVVGAGGSGSNIDLSSVSGNIIPSANITYDLGTPTNRWRDLYLSGSTIDLAGATIKTDATTGAIALIPQPTVAVPDPVGIVITATGALATVSTTAGEANISQISNAVSNSANFASTDYVDTAVANLVNSAPASLNTLNELATALGNDANFSTTITNTLANKLNSDAFTYANITGKPTLGNISAIDLNGNASTVLYGNGVFAEVAGGGASVTVANTAPVANTAGSLWYDNGMTGELYVYDGTSWVSTSIVPMTNASDPTISGVNQANENANITITITNYSNSYSYQITTTAGTTTRSNASIYWQLPAVSANTSHSITVQAVSGSGVASSIVSKSVTVLNTSVTDTAIIVSDFSYSDLNTGWAI